jgi:probable rRNA maturation factor
MPLIQISVMQSQIEINPAQIRLAAAQILNALGYTDAELSVSIVDDEEMERLNREFRQVGSTTDVLAFPMLEGEFGDISPELLGDVVISAPMAKAMSEEHHRPLTAIFHLLLVHGILHLVGYDHERGDAEDREMNEKTLELLGLLGHEDDSFDWHVNGSDEG